MTDPIMRDWIFCDHRLREGTYSDRMHPQGAPCWWCRICGTVVLAVGRG